MTDEPDEDKSFQTFLPLQIFIPTSSTVHGIRSAGHLDPAWHPGTFWRSAGDVEIF
jgi:hypothetical protein